MRDSTRRQITWVIVIGLIAILVIVVAYRHTAKGRVVTMLRTGRPAQRMAAVGKLINEGKLAQAVERQPRWIQDRAVAAALQVGTPQAFCQLLEIVPLVDEPVADRINAGLVMAGARAVGAVAQVLEHRDPAVRGTAPGILGMIGAPAVPALLRMIGVYNEDTRAAVLGALAGVGEPASKPLIEVLKKTGPEPEQSAAEFVRAQETAYGALNAMKVKSLALVLDRLLTSEHASVRETAARLTGDIIDQTSKFFDHPKVPEPIPLVVPIAVEDARVAVKPLITRLADDRDWRVRRQAGLALGRLLAIGNQPKIINALIEALADSRASVKAAAATALGQIGATQIAPILVTTLMDNRSGAVDELQLALRRLGPAAIPALTPALNSEDGETRWLATEILTGIGRRQVVAPLSVRLADASPAIRRLAAETLGRMTAARLAEVTTQEVVSRLLVALDDPDWQVYHAVRETLQRIGAPAVPALIDKLATGDLRSKYMAQQALVNIHGPAIKPLLQALASASGQTRHWVATALGNVGPDIVGPVSNLLKDPTQPPAVRIAAIRALGYTKAVVATELLKTTEAKQPEVRIAVLKAIGDIRDPAATETLVAGLTHSSEQVREEAYSLLKDWQLGEVSECLQQVMQEGDEDARRRASIILAYHSSPEANRLLADVMGGMVEAKEAGTVVEVLTETIQDVSEDPHLRRAAVNNLGSVATPASIGVLVEVLVPGSEFVSEAAHSLAQIGWRAAEASGKAQMGEAAEQLITVLKQTESEELRLEAARALATMEELPVQVLLEGLRSYPEEIRPWAASILAAIGEPATDPILSARGKNLAAGGQYSGGCERKRRSIADQEDDRQYRLWCVAVLHAIGSRQSMLLMDNLPDEEQPDESLITQVHGMKLRILQRM